MNRQLKILHIGPVKISNAKSDANSEFEIMPGLGVDGPSRSVLGLARGLAEAGVETAVLPTKPSVIPENGESRGIRFITPYTGRKHNPFIPTGEWLERIEEKFGRPDLVNFHDVYDLFSCAMASAMHRKGWKYIVTPRGGLRKFAQKRERWKKIVANSLFFNRYLRHAELINALAPLEAEDIVAFDQKLKTVVVPNGLPKEFLSFCKVLPPVEGKIPGEKVVGFLGQIFVEIKGIDRMLEAIRLLQQRGEGKNLKFVFVGPMQKVEDRQWVERLQAALPHPDRVCFVGPKYGKEKWEVLNSFDIFVLPSRTEGMPVVALEAMACGKPCLFSRGSNMAQMIEEAQGGWGCEGDPESLYQKLVAIASTPGERLKEQGHRAQNYIASHLTWDIVVKDYIKMANGILRKER